MKPRPAVIVLAAGSSTRFGAGGHKLTQRLGTMSVQQLMAIVANLGDATLFPPRRDLVSLLDTPLPLVRPLAAVHAPRHVTASSAA